MTHRDLRAHVEAHNLGRGLIPPTDCAGTIARILVPVKLAPFLAGRSGYFCRDCGATFTTEGGRVAWYAAPDDEPLPF